MSEEEKDNQWRPSQDVSQFGKIRRLTPPIKEGNSNTLPAQAGESRNSKQERIARFYEGRTDEPVPQEAGEKKEKLVKKQPGVIGRAIVRLPVWAVLAALFVTPLFYFFSSDTLRLAKHLVLVGLAAVALAGLAGRVVVTGRVQWRAPWLMGALGAVVAAVLLSTFFSSSSLWVSLLGDAGRYSAAALSIIAYAVLSLVALATFDREEAFAGVLGVLGAHAVLVVVALLHFFNVFVLPGAFTEQEAFNPLGSLFALATWCGVMLPLILGLADVAQKRWVKVMSWGMFAATLLVLLAVDVQRAWIIVAISLFAYVVFVFVGTKVGWPARHANGGDSGKHGARVVIPVFMIVLALFAAVSPGALTVPLVEVPFEVLPSWQVSGQVVTETVQASPVFGSGPETFPYAYGEYKPAAVNSTRFWGINFVDGQSEALGWAATLGVLGAAALLAFLVLAIRAARRKGGVSANALTRGLGATWVGVASAFFVATLNVPLFLLFWTMPILFLVLLGAERATYIFKEGSRSAFVAFILSLILLLVAAGTMYGVVQRWRAEASFVAASAEEEGSDIPREEQIRRVARAIDIQPYEARYYHTLAKLLGSEANEMVAGTQQGGGLTQETISRIEERTAQAVQAMERAVALDPRNTAYLATMGELYTQISSYVEGALGRAQATYRKAATFEPVNPLFRTQLAQLYLVEADFFNNQNVRGGEKIEQAREELERAAELNPRYANALYLLGLVYERQGQQGQAIAAFERVAELNPDNALIQVMLENLRAGRPALSSPQPELPADPEEGS